MKPLQESDISHVLSYLKENIDRCVYLYIDLKNYQLLNENVSFWCAEDTSGYNTVVMKYYDSFQIFSAFEEWDLSGTIELLNKYAINVINGPESMIKPLHEEISGLFYARYGIVVTDDRYRELKLFSMVEQAHPEDACEIAALMCSHHEFKNVYNQEVLAEQLRFRLETKTGRSFIIRRDGKIVSHVGTFAETDDAAVISGLAADAQYDRHFYGMAVYEYIKKVLLQENKLIYAMRYNDDMLKNAKAASMRVCARFGKMTKR